MPNQQVPLTTPLKGVVRAVAREGQPPETCWDAQNVLPYDRYGRKRLAQRGGLLRQFSNTTGAFIQGMIEAPNIVYPPGVISTPIGGLASLPGFPGTFNASDPTPIAGPTIPGPFTGNWVWTFQFGLLYASTPGFTTPRYQAAFFFPTWIDTSGGSPVTHGFYVGMYALNSSNTPTTAGPSISVVEGIAGTPPTWTNGHPTGSIIVILEDNGSGTDPISGLTAIWTFRLSLDAGGNMDLFDVTDGVDSGSSPLAVIPQFIPYPNFLFVTGTNLSAGVTSVKIAD